MEDNKERLLKDFEGRLLPHFAPEDVDTITRCMMMTLSEFRVEKEPRELAVLDDYNDRLLKAYSGCLAIEGKSDKTIAAYLRELRKVSDLLNKNFNQMGTFDLRFYLAAIQSSYRKYSG